MVASGAVVIAAAGLSPFQEAILLILFCLIASLGVLFPLLIYLFFRSAVASIFARLKIWLQRYSSLILLMVLLVFGGIALYRGILLVGMYSG